MRISQLLGLAVALAAAACSQHTGASGTGNVNAMDAGIQGSNGNGSIDGLTAQDTGPAITQCATDTDCQTAGTLCVGGVCAKSCVASTECGTGESCFLSADRIRAGCVKIAYPADTGKPCAMEDKCGDNTACQVPAAVAYSECKDKAGCAATESAHAVCTALCTTDVDCPTQMACGKVGSGDHVCTPRSFCSPCVSDEQCGPGGLCVAHSAPQDDGTFSGPKFCSIACSGKKSGECPAYAACTDLDGDGQYVCTHKNATCQTDTGAQCDPCVETEGCASNALCLTYPNTGESFCGTQCDAKTPCGTGYTCSKVSTTQSYCTPTKNTCVKALGTILKTGDVFPDFAMVGYYDSNKNNDLTDEQPELLHLTDFNPDTGKYKDANVDTILFMVSAGWCTYCQQETAKFKAEFPDLRDQKGLMIFQVLFDGMGEPSTPTLKFVMNNWIKPLKAQGAVGIDPDKLTGTMIGDGPPLNVVLDARTLKIKVKVNGSPQQTMADFLAPYLKK